MVDVMYLLIATMLATAILLGMLIFKYRNLYLKERSSKASFLVKNGKMMEHLIPWMNDFPGDPRGFRFIGNPIDGILFDEDSIVFVEFKTGNSRLNHNQKKVKDLVKSKKVKWREIRVN